MSLKGYRARDTYAGVDDTKVVEDYFRKNDSGGWAYTLKAIRKKYGFKSDSNVMDRIRRSGKPRRSTLDGHETRVKAYRHAAEEGNGSIAKRFNLVKGAISTQVIRAAITSPRSVKTIHEVAKGIAHAMGVNAPSLQEIAGSLGKLVS